MEALRYFLLTPSRYRRDATLMCTGLLTVALTPVLWLFVSLQPAALAGPRGAMENVVEARWLPPVSTISATAPGQGPIWPANGIVTAEFGGTGHPFTGTHTGIDIAGPASQPVIAFRPGVVTAVGAISSGCGRCVFIDHGNGLTSHYSHLSTTAAVVGQQVTAGSVIGYQGNTGWSTGPHVHFEIKLNGTPVNPRNYVAGNPAR
jgi:murein DD-endopeptidase MepM/ murein hydrolase activator NlpD